MNISHSYLLKNYCVAQQRYLDNETNVLDDWEEPRIIHIKSENLGKFDKEKKIYILNEKYETWYTRCRRLNEKEETELKQALTKEGYLNIKTKDIEITIPNIYCPTCFDVDKFEEGSSDYNDEEIELILSDKVTIEYDSIIINNKTISKIPVDHDELSKALRRIQIFVEQELRQIKCTW